MIQTLNNRKGIGLAWGVRLKPVSKEMQCRDIFEMDSEEFSRYLEPIAATLIAKAFDDGLYVSYHADGNMPNHFIHEYKDGRKVVVQIDLITGKELIVPLPQS